MALLFSETIPEGEYLLVSRLFVACLLISGALFHLWGVYKANSGIGNGLGWKNFGSVQVVLIATAAFFVFETRPVIVKVTHEYVNINAGLFYSTTVPLARISLPSVIIHPQTATPNLTFRTNGLALPGYKKGWFRDSEGRRVYAAYGRGSFVTFSTTEGVMYVLGSGNADRLAAALGTR